MYAPEGVANPRTPIVGRTFFCSERGDKVHPALETEWDVVAGKRMRLERCTAREMVRALADAVFREGIMVSDKGLDCMLGPSARWLRVFAQASSGSRSGDRIELTPARYPQGDGLLPQHFRRPF